MNEIRRKDRYAEEIARIREIVGRHRLPDFVTGFDVRLGEFDGDPAMWIVFKTHEGTRDNKADLQKRVKQGLELQQAVRNDLLNAIDDRFPYFRYESVQ